MGNTIDVIFVPIVEKSFMLFSRCKVTIRLKGIQVVTMLRGEVGECIMLEVTGQSDDSYFVKIPGTIMAGFRTMRAEKSFYHTKFIRGHHERT